MDWKLIAIGLAMLASGGFLAWRLRKAKFGSETGPGCIMAFALILLLIGVIATVMGFMFKAS